ncbi:glycerophosphodiester phosphodiesterase [Shewanella schlegeliana]|uniref:Glycerophosphodiester phosphodiesterase n=1 Tax=Shewanella schlegeliana TaxID=190308 RepID=A0ABS1SWR9_9GAMM|nr:glycerophosphodiester phosphodiesterase family protein [Shewanella schlegeliana]MBL4912790.1 glycerophosphodiester phosphodiesterase [Shewanella schlegeliana]MCL1109112.1 glycerophosphodiester phosphodiesterase [Shewanella schlegeliana]GIU38017.1 glycerophosphoryl diester phosphodiesterase [Shewanella schlegeliana]
MMIFAHRGASGYLAENTLAAFAKAVELGATAVELDVHLVEDELYVFHDRRLEPKSSGIGLIEELTKQALSEINIAGEPIPTLTQVLDLLKPHNTLVNIELKGLGCLDAFIALYPKLIGELGYDRSKLLMSSFNHPFLASLKRRFPNAIVAPLIEGVPLELAKVVSQLDAYSIHLGLNFTTQEMVDDAHKRGAKVYVYTVDNLEDLDMLKQMGVDGIFTNYPDRAIAHLNPS